MNQKIHDFNSHLTTRSNEMGFWFVPVLRPNPNIFSNKNAQNHYSSSNIPPLKIPKRAFFRSPFKQSSASQLSMIQPCIQVQLIQQAKPRFTKNESWNLSDGAPKKDSSYLCSSYSHNLFFFFPLPHKSDGKKKEILFHLCNRTNYLQAEGMLGDHALCFVGPTCVTGRLCPQEWINLETSTQAAEEAVARGLQEMWEPWRVLVSTPHPSPLDAFL